MQNDDVLRDVRNAAHRLLRGVAGHVGRQRYERDCEENGSRAAFQLVGEMAHPLSSSLRSRLTSLVRRARCVTLVLGFHIQQLAANARLP
jgi:hypothetical protein